ncbi:hypothetical protein G9G63_10020 [Paenibacillus sp. EKM202P]|uniref:hypothetical protein n=1 Tax=unclassified Paenibacillus TaxID=185978 RepID=UPI0013EB5631|nr:MULTISPECIES: hypothetical protein [unclassified Paenibacillus]KAF6565484.1 hypothetical protein G9G63_10020 [Paenibacillus sp. EKM202P]KAF6569191.1 hypothetical protein G9G64_12075 [Paenibacillus sp. EKM207P]
MNDLYIIGGVVLFVVAGAFMIPHFRKRGVKIDSTSDILKSIDIGKLVLEVIPLTEQYKGKANFVLDITTEAIEYVHNYANGALTLEQKERVALDTVDGLLHKMKITPTEQELELISILVHEGIRLLDTSVAATPVFK